MGTSCLKRMAGTYVLPRPSLAMPAWPAVEEMGRAALAALAAPGDFLALDKVGAVVQQRYAEVLWIRLQIADADPAGLLVTLLGLIARLGAEWPPGIAQAAARHARLGDWGMTYQLVARWLATATARPAVLVLEGAEHLETGSPAALDLLVSAFLPYLPGSLDVLLIGFREWDNRRLDPHSRVLGPSRLALDRRAVAVLAEACLPGLPTATLDRGFTLTRGAAGALQAVFAAGAVLGPEVFCAATERAADRQELLGTLGHRLLAGAEAHTLAALAGASRLGVWHPTMAAALGYSASERREPWWLDLAEGWRQLIPAWRAPLRSAAGGSPVLAPASLTLLADHLARHGVWDRALELYLEAGDVDRAADTAVSIAEDLANAGGWATLARLGQSLARDSSAARRDREPGDITHRPAPWLWRRFVRGGRRSSGPAGHAHPVRLPEVTAKAGVAPGPPVGTVPIALLPGHRAESLSVPRAIPGTLHVAPPDVTAHLLGELRVAFHGHQVETWASGRGRAVFEYLLVNRHSRVRRDRLMSVFWPDASCDAARNSLNVALHGLRQSLRTVAGDRAVVIYREQAYFIEQTLDLWVDVEAFEERLKSAHQHLASSEPIKAQADLEGAIYLYQGDFLADDPYEDWAIVRREHLRLCYLDALDRLSELRLNSGDYAGCVVVLLKLLTCDNCREDAHCRLMRCYSRQGQLQLALRQYHSCAAALRMELGVAPAPATTELFNRIRCREEV